METEVAALERRLLALQTRLGVKASDAPGKSIPDRFRELSDSLTRLEGSLDPPNAAPLRAAYLQHKALLEKDVANELKNPSASSQQLKKAIVFTSADILAENATRATQLHELERSLAKPPTISQDVHKALERIETQNMLDTQRILAQHEAVEALATQYAAIVHGMSKKFQLYDQLLSQLERR